MTAIRHRIINGILGLLSLYITVSHALWVCHEVSALHGFTFRALYKYISGPLSVLGWAFITFCFFYVDVFGICSKVVHKIKRAKRIKKIKQTRIDYD